MVCRASICDRRLVPRRCPSSSARPTTSAAYYEALGCTEGDQLQKKLKKNRRALGWDDSGL
jgi:hypothetical protein